MPLDVLRVRRWDFFLTTFLPVGRWTTTTQRLPPGDKSLARVYVIGFRDDHRIRKIPQGN